MKKLAAIAILGLSLLTVFSGCTYTQARSASAGSIAEATKEGHAKCFVVLGLFRGGDCSVSAAAANGGITEVITVDAIESNYMVYQGFDVVVRGK